MKWNKEVEGKKIKPIEKPKEDKEIEPNFAKNSNTWEIWQVSIKSLRETPVFFIQSIQLTQKSTRFASLNLSYLIFSYVCVVLIWFAKLVWLIKLLTWSYIYNLISYSRLISCHEDKLNENGMLLNFKIKGKWLTYIYIYIYCALSILHLKEVIAYLRCHVDIARREEGLS